MTTAVRSSASRPVRTLSSSDNREFTPSPRSTKAGARRSSQPKPTVGRGSPAVDPSSETATAVLTTRRTRRRPASVGQSVPEKPENTPPASVRRSRKSTPAEPILSADELSAAGLEEIAYISNPLFDGHPESETLIALAAPFDVEQERARAGQRPAIPSNLPSYVAGLYEIPLLGPQREQEYFLRMNYLRALAEKQRQRLLPGRSRHSALQAVQSLIAQSLVIRNEILRANLRLVVSIARKLADDSTTFDELVSEGNFPLLRAIELFDVSRGYRFSTYATWAVRNHLRRYLADRSKHRSRFSTAEDFVMQSAIDDRGTATGCEQHLSRNRHLLNRILHQLSEREQYIVSARFGLDHAEEPQTLSQIGRHLGISKERVRQLALTAVQKMHEIATLHAT